MIFDKEIFKKNAPKNITRILSSHIESINGKEAVFEGADEYGTIEYEHEGEEFELYPVYPDWCREES